MSYLHIDNLYRSQDILMFRECYALEKIHGTSAHISWKEGKIHFFAGGCAQVTFEAIFNHPELKAAFEKLGETEVVVFGEAYGGKMQKMSHTYGKELRFIAFEVKIGEHWLSVPDMTSVAEALGFEVVPWIKIPATLEAIDAQRDLPSELAIRRGCGTDKLREGVVLRPLIELRKSSGDRIVAKHKSDPFKERATPQKVVSPDKLVVLKEAKAIANEWVTLMRLTHVLDKIPAEKQVIENMKGIIEAMVEDVYREGQGELEPSKEATQAIGARTAFLFKERLKQELKIANQ